MYVSRINAAIPPTSNQAAFSCSPLVYIFREIAVILNNVPVTSGVRECPVLAPENKMARVSPTFQYLNSKTDPGIEELGYSFHIGVELLQNPLRFHGSVRETD